MYTFLLQGHQDHRLQARTRVYLSVIIRFYCVHFDISCKSEKYQFCGKIMLWNSGATSGHRETKASWPLPTVTQAMSQNMLIMICFSKRPTAETKPSLSPVSLPKGSPASTPGKYTRCGWIFWQMCEIFLDRGSINRKEGLTVPRTASLAISPTYCGNNRSFEFLKMDESRIDQMEHKEISCRLGT